MLSGCASDWIVERETARNSADKPPAYAAGYSDGCNTGIKENNMAFAGKNVRDDARMKTDADYALGWNDGARQCGQMGSGGGAYVIRR